MENGLDQLAAPANDAAQGIAVPTEIFAGTVDHQVGAKLQRMLVDGGGEGIVGDHHRTDLVSPARQALDINYLKRGVSGSLQVEQFAAVRDLRLDSAEVRGIAKAGADIDLWQEFAEQLIGAA